MTDETKTPTVRVRPVADRMVRDAVSREIIDDERDVPDTRAIRRAIAAGDLELVERDTKPEGRSKKTGTQLADDLRPQHVDTSLTVEERRAAREADVRTLEKEKF